jgi:hypothetical protein
VKGLGVSLAAACSCASKVHSQDDLVEPCEDNAEHMGPAAEVELHSESSDCREGGRPAVHMSPKNGCRHSHCCHSKTVGVAYLDGMAASQILPQNSRCFQWETHEDAPERAHGLVLAGQLAAVVLVPSFVSLT